MTDTLMPDAADTARAMVAGYFEMWNEADPARRRAVIERTWATDASYLDPMFAAEGADALDGLVAQVHARYPGHRFRLAGAVDAHHDRVRWGWDFTGPGDGAPVMSGIDFAVLAGDGRLREVTGFFAGPSGAAGGTGHDGA